MAEQVGESALLRDGLGCRNMIGCENTNRQEDMNEKRGADFRPRPAKRKTVK